MFAQAEGMKTAIDDNTKEITEEIRLWCVNEAHRLEELRKDLRHFVFSHLKELTARKLKCGFYYTSSIGPFRYRYTNDTISFETKWENGIAVEVSDIEVENDANSKVGVFYSRLRKPLNRFIWDFDKIFSSANERNSDIDFWIDAKLWLAIENEMLNYFADELKKVVKELVATQKERFNRISKTYAEVMEKPKTVKVVLEIHQ